MTLDDIMQALAAKASAPEPLFGVRIGGRRGAPMALKRKTTRP